MKQTHAHIYTSCLSLYIYTLCLSLYSWLTSRLCQAVHQYSYQCFHNMFQKCFEPSWSVFQVEQAEHIMQKLDLSALPRC